MTATSVLTASVLLLAGAAGHGAAYYVSPEGSDANAGSAKGAPLRTIQAAVDRAQPGDTILVAGGAYRETITFPRSGEPGRPIAVQAAEGAEVMVTGCEPVAGWERYSDTIWKAPMPWTLGLGRNQVFAGDQVMIEARFPNEPAPGLGMYVSDLSPLWPTFGAFSIPDALKEPGRITSPLLDGQPDDCWKGALYYGVHYEGWAAQTGVVESSKSGEITVGDRTQTWWFGQAYGGGYQPEDGHGMIVGHLNALDRPGEWHWQDGTLYLIPLDGQEPTGIEAKQRQLAFDLSGREHIHLAGLNVRAASMRLEDSAYCTVERCNLSYISHYLRHYSIGQVEHDRDTIRSGETGIYLGGHDNSFLSCSVRFSAGTGFYLRGYHQTIHNCLIDEVSYTAHYLNAITDAVSDFPDYENRLVGGHVITYNTMRNASRHFFNFYGNGTSLQSRTRGPMDYMATLFAHNHLYNGMLQTKDAGLITGYYCSGGTLDGLNSQVIYNVIHESYDLAAMRWGVLGLIYLDAGTCDVDLHHNLLWAAPGSLQRGLWYNTMCVDIHEHDDLFIPEFTRTCAELTSDDFPEGKPFRFGHDFENPPPLADWPPLVEERVPTSVGRHTALQDGDVIPFGDVDLDEGWQAATVEFASDVKEVNTDGAARQSPRHQKATDPLVLEAVARDEAEARVAEQWTFIRNVRDGAWIRFNRVPLGEGYRRFRAVYGNDQEAPSRLEVRLDSVDGPKVADVALPQTDRPRGGSVQIYASATGEVTPEAQGTHDVFLVFHADGDKPVGEFEYFRFEQYRGQIALQPTEVKLELHVGSAEGEKIGEFYPRPTGGADAFREMVATLEPASGVQPLFLVVRSALPGPMGAIGQLTFQRAKGQYELRGIGDPPLVRDGKMVLPQPTNRPCARPGDQFPQAAAAPRPRALCAAERLAAPPSVDGRLDEWPADGRAVDLKESWDGTRSTAAPSRAWVAYDDQALYIGARHPVKDAAALDYASHEWGATDAMEVALQDGLSAAPGPILNLYGWPDGHFVSTDRAGAPADVVARLQAAVTYQAAIDTAEWTCEWRIPFEAAGFTPQRAPLVLFNLGVRHAAEGTWAIWRGTGSATYRVQDAGVVAFPTELTAAGPPQEGLEVWLDATGNASVERDAAGAVSLWRDRSGKVRDAAQPDAALRPTYVADALNGKPALRFTEDSTTRLELPDLSEERITATVLAVFSNPTPGAEVNHDPRIFTASDGQGFDYQVGLAASVPGMETGGPRQGLWVFEDRWAKSVRVGSFSPNYQTYFTGLISEILVYSRALSPAEQDRARAYLMLKWDLGQ